MNSKRRKQIEKARGMIEEAVAILEEMMNEEQDYYDNMPEGLQGGEKGEKAQECIDNLQSSVTDCGSVLDSIESALE